GFIRDAGMFADSGAKTPPGLGTATSAEVAAAVVKAVEHNRVEIVVAPLIDRVAAHFSLVSPSIAVRAQSGAAGQKASEAIAAGHAENSKDKR
ncbi:MAG TPA: oxidoreductase, partial [Solirubrobacterales bacterium]